MAHAERWVFYHHRPDGSVLRIVEKRNEKMVILDGENEKPLKPQESLLLRFFLQRAGQQLTDDELVEAVWGRDKTKHQLGQPLNGLKKGFEDEGHLIITVQKRPVRYQFLKDRKDLIEAPGSSPIKLATLGALRWIKKGELINPLHILDARLSWLPFTGRGDDCDELWRWINHPAPVSLKVLAGQGGRGKTRLAIHLLERLEKERSGEWHAGFLENHVDDVLRSTNFREWQPHKRTLIIIDDASRWSEELAQFVVGPLSEQRGSEFARRFLLIDRAVDRRFEWYRRLLDASRKSPGRIPILAEPLHLRPLQAESELGSRDRQKILDDALSALHAIDGKPKLVIDDAADAALARPEMGDPLVILMAAVVAHDRQDLAPLTHRRLALADELVGRERERIASLTRSSRLLFHMAAYITLTRGLSREELTTACEEEKKAIDPDSQCSVADLKGLIAQKALPSNVSPFDAAPIVPDIVGEVFIESVFQSPDHEAVEMIVRSFRRHPKNVTATLLNMVMDFAQAAKDSVDIVPRESALLEWIEAVLERLAPDLNVVGTKETWGYRTPHALLLVEELATIKPRVFLPHLARSRRDWGKTLVAAGEHGAAFHQFEDGLRKIKPLALSDPARYWDLASTVAAEYGQQESADHYLFCPFFILRYTSDRNLLREYVRLIPSQDLAQHIRMLSERAANTGEASSSRLVLPEVRLRYEALSSGNPRALAIEEALNLESQALFWADAGYAKEAVDCAESATSRLAELCHIDRRAYLPHLASCYATIADAQSKQLNSVASFDAISKAVHLFRELADLDPAFRSPLGLSVLKLSILQIRNRKTEALELLKEATEYYREAESTTNPSMVTHTVSNTLYNLQAVMQWEMGDEHGALELLTQKCSIPHAVVGGTIICDQYVPYVAAVSAPRALPKSAKSYEELVFEHEEPSGIAWQYTLSERIEAEYALRVCNDAWTGQMYLTSAIENCQALADQDPGRFQHHLDDWTELKRQWLLRYDQTPSPESTRLPQAVLETISKITKQVRSMAEDHQRSGGQRPEGSDQ